MSEAAFPAGVRPFLASLRRFHADVTPHSGRHLIDHLAGTYGLLEAWGNGPAVCRAGLFHSIYGTNLFTVRPASLAERGVIRAVIGEAAERLAYLFCVTDRPLALLRAAIAREYRLRDIVHQVPLSIEPHELCQLLEIEVANFLEQPDDADVIRQIRDILARIDPPMISPGARAAFDTYLAG